MSLPAQHGAKKWQCAHCSFFLVTAAWSPAGTLRSTAEDKDRTAVVSGRSVSHMLMINTFFTQHILTSAHASARTTGP